MSSIARAAGRCAGRGGRLGRGPLQVDGGQRRAAVGRLPVEPEAVRALRQELDVGGEANRLQAADDGPGRVDFPPLVAVARRALERVMVVVPALAPRDEPHPPAVGRTLGRVVRAVAEGVRRRSYSVWCMRCIPTQLMAPPSLARLPQIVKKYSRAFGIRNPRWVRRRW